MGNILEVAIVLENIKDRHAWNLSTRSYKDDGLSENYKRKRGRKSVAELSTALIQTHTHKKGDTFQPQGTGPAAASQSKKGQNKTKGTSCVSEGQDGNQTERMAKART